MDTAPQLPELLAPAGTIEAGLAALDAGADAVYAGLPRFNARERSENLSPEELRKLLAYAHREGRKLYVTLNTLVKECELAEVADILVELAVLRPDAVIVQDVGLVRLIRERFPCLTIHASTQMGIHNSAGVAAAQSMGISRVILQRQTTYEEIRLIRERSDVELEVFIHGALCCGRSGACLFSSWMGGWSGNRGRCKQPCRRRYFSPDGNGFFFSPGDLYSLEAVPELSRLGVASLKIEGRLRRADYVEHVVRAYRSVLDAAGQAATDAVREARRILAGSLGRKWVPAFTHAARFESAIDHESLGTSGRIVGRVAETGAGGFAVDVSRGFEVGDVLRVQPSSGDEGPVVTAQRLAVDRRPVTRVSRGARCWVYCDKPVPADGLVFKTAGVESDLSARVADLPVSRPAVDLDVTVSEAQVVVDVAPLALRWEHALATQPARSRPLTAGAVAAEFTRSAESRLAAAEVAVDVRGEWFVPASELKRVRRAFWAWIDGRVGEEELRTAWRACARDLDALKPRPPDDRAVETVVIMKPGAPNPIPGAVRAALLEDFGDDAEECILPDFCPEAKLDELREGVRDLRRAGVRRFRVTSLYGLEVLGPPGELDVTVSFPLPVCNGLALAELFEMGVCKATAWVELERESVHELAACAGSALEVYRYGRLPLLSTRFSIPAAGRIADGRGGVFFVRKTNDLTRLYPELVFAVEPPAGVATCVDLSAAEWGETVTSSFNFERSLV